MENVDPNEVRLFDKVIQIEINRENAPPLILYDLPGINQTVELREESARISEKFLKDEGASILLVMSAGEEVDNSFAARLITENPNIKNWEERVIPVITKADLLIDTNNLDPFLSQIKKLKFINKTCLIVSKWEKYKDLSFDEMILKEEELLSKIKNINNYNINKGVVETINYLAKIQINNFKKSFPIIDKEVEKNILSLTDQLKKYKSEECNSKEDVLVICDRYIDLFRKTIEKKMYSLECNPDGSPNKNLMKYQIKIIFLKYKENTKKKKMNKLLNENFISLVTNNTIQINADSIATLEDTVPFQKLIKPELISILDGLDNVISEVYIYMKNEIDSIIDDSFGKYEYLIEKVKDLFNEYSYDKKSHVEEFFKENIMELYTSFIITYDDEGLISKTNLLNREILSDVLDLNTNEQIVNDNDIHENEENLNENLGEDVVNKFGENLKHKKSIIKNTINHTIYKSNKKSENNPYDGKVKLGYVLGDIAELGDKIVDPNYLNYFIRNEFEYVPGFQCLLKEDLMNFKRIIKEGKVEIKTANVITKIIAYIELTLNEIFDSLYKKILLYLYCKLTNSHMIDYIKRNIYLLDFEESRKLLSISEDDEIEKEKLNNELNEFKEAKRMIDKVKSKAKSFERNN